MASGQTLSLVPIGTVSTANLVYIFSGNFTVGTGATLSVGTGTSVLIDPVTITDNGTHEHHRGVGRFRGGLRGDDADSGQRRPCPPAAPPSTPRAGSYESFTLLQVDSGGELIATSTTFSVNELNLVNGSIMNTGDLTNDVFNLPIYVPFQDIAPCWPTTRASRTSTSSPGAMASGQALSLVPIGTVSTANLVYIFSGNFTVGTGATLSVGTGTSVLIDPVTITDNGTMNVTGASVGFVAGYEATTQILVNGTLSASGSSSIPRAAAMASFTLLQVDSGGELTATNSTFAVNELSLNAGSTDDLQSRPSPLSSRSTAEPRSTFLGRLHATRTVVASGAHRHDQPDQQFLGHDQPHANRGQDHGPRQES